MLNHVVNAGGELHSVSTQRIEKQLGDEQTNPVCSLYVYRHTHALPDALWGLNDGLDDVVSDELAVLFGDVTPRRFAVRVVTFAPVLRDHVLQIDHA